MRALIVVMLDEVHKDATELALAHNEQPQSGHSVRAVRTNLSANAFARGDRTGVWMTRAPTDLKASSKRPTNLASRSGSRKRTARPWSSRVIAMSRACWVARPRRASGHASQEDLTTLEVDEEQHIKPPQRDRADAEEVARERACSLCSEEL